MALKKVIQIVLIAACSVAYTHADETTCPNYDEQAKCKCSKSPSSRNRLVLECDQIKEGDLIHSFSKLMSSGDAYYKILVSNSDLTGIGEFPESTRGISVLILHHVQGIDAEKLKDLISPLTDLEDLVVDGGIQIETLKSDLIGDKFKLKKLFLNNVGIKKVEEDAFNLLTALEELSLEGNELQEIPDAAVGRPNLFVRLTDNKITQVNEDITNKIRQRAIKVTLNNLECTCEAKDKQFIKMVRENAMDDIKCTPNEKLKETEIKRMTDKHFCPDSASSLASSLFMIMLLPALYFY